MSGVEQVLLTEGDFDGVAAEAGIYKNVASHLFNMLSGKRNPQFKQAVVIDPVRGEPAIPTEVLGSFIQTNQYLYRVGRAGRELMDLMYSQYHPQAASNEP